MELPVETRQLTKRYGAATAVDSLDLTVRPGEVYGFLGPNGAGKTTTLRMLLGLIKSSSGTVRVLGRRPGTADHLSRVGALIEGPSFYPYLSGRANLRVMAKYAKVPDSRVTEVLELVDLAARGKDRYSTYSLGMKQRLGVAAALLKEPQLLILDEPTNGLDPQGMADMRTLIRDLGSQGCTVLLSSHMLSEVQQICDRVGIIASGRLITESSVAKLRSGRYVRVGAEPLGRAATVARRLLGEAAVRVVDEHLELDLAADKTAWFNAELVAAEIGVHELRVRERDLEEIFFELTGEELSHVG